MPRGQSVFGGLQSFALAGILATNLAVLRADGLDEDLVQDWENYVRLTERRIDSELKSNRGWLGISFNGPDNSSAARGEALKGDVFIEKLKTNGALGQKIEIRGGKVHHCRGLIFIPAVTLDAVLDRSGDSLRVYLKLQRSTIVTATFNTEHLVKHRRHGPKRASSRSIATKVAELANAGSPQEREKPLGEDRGFLWGMNSYWRYEETQGGVLVECESITLSRSIPGFVSPFVNPIVNRVAKESMARTLKSLRDRLGRIT